MKIEDLQDGQVVTVRTTRAGGADEEGPKWSDWYQAALGIQRDRCGLPFEHCYHRNDYSRDVSSPRAGLSAYLQQQRELYERALRGMTPAQMRQLPQPPKAWQTADLRQIYQRAEDAELARALEVAVDAAILDSEKKDEEAKAFPDEQRVSAWDRLMDD